MRQSKSGGKPQQNFLCSISYIFFCTQESLRYKRSSPIESTAIFEYCGSGDAGGTPKAKMVADMAAPTGRVRSSTTTYSMSNVSRYFL